MTPTAIEMMRQWLASRPAMTSHQQMTERVYNLKDSMVRYLGEDAGKRITQAAASVSPRWWQYRINPGIDLEAVWSAVRAEAEAMMRNDAETLGA